MTRFFEVTNLQNPIDVVICDDSLYDLIGAMDMLERLGDKCLVKLIELSEDEMDEFYNEDRDQPEWRKKSKKIMTEQVNLKKFEDEKYYSVFLKIDKTTSLNFICKTYGIEKNYLYMADTYQFTQKEQEITLSRLGNVYFVLNNILSFNTYRFKVEE